MADVIEILIAKYPDADAAEAALKKLHTAKENQGVDIMDAAVVRKDDAGKLHIHETDDVSGKRGAAVGAILGGVLGLMAGPAGLVVGAALGAAVGGGAASVIDTGIPHKQLAEIGASLAPHTAALVVLTEAGFVDFIESVIGGEDIQVINHSMDTQAANKLGHDHDVAVQALKMGDALADGGAIPNE